MTILFAPYLRGTDPANAPIAGAFASFYATGTSTQQPIYADAALSIALSNPVQADGNGVFPQIWLDDSLEPYKVVLQYPDVNNPSIPGAIVAGSRGTIDPYNSPVSLLQLIDQLQPQTDTEIAAGIVPTNFAYLPGDLRRYGGDPLGLSDASAAWQAAVNVGVARIPKGCSFKILTPATKTGQVTILGEGPTSKLLCDGTVLTLTSGSNSVIDNFRMENITAPYVIVRNPASWPTVITTATQSNTTLGYQPTINDPEYATLYGTYGAVLSTTISPTIATTGNASDVLISRIYGRFVYLNLKDLTNSMVCDCDFRGGRGPISAGSGGGGGPLGCIVFDNVTSGLQVGRNNRASRNTVTYASFSAIAMLGNFDGIMEDNICCLNGESGLKINHGDSLSSKHMILIGNVCNQNYYDGIDADSSVPPSDAQSTYQVITNNSIFNNRGTGINLDGKYNVCSANHMLANGTFGLWLYCSYSVISDNVCVSNNTVNDPSNADILAGVQGNLISGNFIRFTASAGFPLYASQPGGSSPHKVIGNVTSNGTNFYGNTGSIVPVVENTLDANSDTWTTQGFTLTIANSAGTLQATFSSDAGTVLPGNFGSRVIGASLNTPIPTGTDASTAMAGGGKIGSAATNRFWLNTAAQNALNSYGIAVVGSNTSTTAVNVLYGVASANINGVTIVRPYFDFFNAATGAAFGLTTANIGAGKNVQVQFLGKLA